MSGKSIGFLSVIALIVVSLSGIVWFTDNQTNLQMGSSGMDSQTDERNITVPFNDHNYSKDVIGPKEGQPVKNIILIAQEQIHELKKGLFVPVWTYNGTVPGEEIRVEQGDFVQVELFNNLPEPITIHWHGYPVIAAMDGIPGVTQDSILPGEKFVYQFSADTPGTYWYHSHQEGAKQVDKGLYGSLIVEPKGERTVDRDYTLILDEWMSNPVDEMESMSGMENQKAVDLVKEEEMMMASMYDIYTVNGKSGEIIEPLNVKKGDVVKLRFINAGYRSHGIHIPGQDIRVVSTDGQTIQGAGVIRDQVITISPGERYDIEFTVNTENSFVIDAHDTNQFNNQLRIPVHVMGGNGNVLENATETLANFDLLAYGQSAKGAFSLEQKYDVDYNVELNTDTTNKKLQYTINGKVFEELPALKLKSDQMVKFTVVNKSEVDHPMHLHGHFFQVLSGNGKPYSGAVIMKDTLLVRPGETYIIAFRADNPGAWVQHCHELHHAAGGMMQKIIYTDYLSNYEADPNNAFNKPE